MYQERAALALPPAWDHAGLRNRYKASYQEYIAVFSLIISQKNQMEALLKSDSDPESGVADLLEAKELSRLAGEHQRLKDELESIKRTFLSGKNEGESPGSD